jgi:hypothetical protein
MKTLVKKMTSVGLIIIQFIMYTITMIAVAILLPAVVFSIDDTMIVNPTAWAIVILGILFFVFVEVVIFIRPFLMYRKLPLALVETDGEFLYIHANKEAKIPLASLTYATVNVDMPYLLQKSFLRQIITNIFSNEYGTITLELEEFGSYKIRFAAHAQEASDELIRFIDQAMNNAG